MSISQYVNCDTKAVFFCGASIKSDLNKLPIGVELIVIFDHFNLDSDVNLPITVKRVHICIDDEIYQNKSELETQYNKLKLPFGCVITVGKSSENMKFIENKSGAKMRTYYKFFINNLDSTVEDLKNKSSYIYKTIDDQYKNIDIIKIFTKEGPKISFKIYV